MRQPHLSPHNTAVASTPIRIAQLSWCAALACMSVACTVTQPIQRAGADAVFPAGAPNAACTATGTCPPPAPADMNQYAGGLGAMVWRVEQRRIELAQQAADVTNTATTYNALLWPLSLLAIISKLNTPSESLAAPAAIGITSYGFLSQGIPERDKLYLHASRTLACAVLGSSVFLYRREEISNAFSDQRTLQDLEQLSYTDLPLDSAHRVLDDALRAYRTARRDLLNAVPPPRTVSGTQTANSAERRSLEARGQYRGASTQKDQRVAISTHTDKQLRNASMALAKLEQLRRRVLNEASQLQARWQRVEHGLQFELSARTPDLKRFDAVLSDFQTDAGANKPPTTTAPTADSASGQGRGAEAVDDLDWTLPPSLAAQVPKTMQKELAAFDTQALQLQQARGQAQRWVQLSHSRSETMRKALNKQRCDADAVITAVPPAPTPSPAPVAAPPPAAHQRTTTPATPPSGTELPNLGEG